MEQAIPAVFGGGAKSKAFDSAGPYKMSSASNEKIKVTGGDSDTDEEDSSSVVPFIHILNQQISRTDKSANDENSSTMQGDVTSKELRQPPADLNGSAVTAKADQAESSFEALLKDVGLNNVNGAKTEQAKVGTTDLQLPPANTPVEEDVTFEGLGMDKQSVLKTGRKNIQAEMQAAEVISGEDRVSETAADKISVNLTELKRENKTTQDILSAASGKEDYAAVDRSRPTAQEMKESLNSKDNSGQQYLKSLTGKAENKSQTDAMQAGMGDAAGKTSAEQKEKIVTSGKGNEEVSLTAVNASGVNSASTEKVHNVSPDKIIGQVTGEIKEAAANDGGRMKIALNPPDLGKLEMDVIVRNGKVEVTLVADNKDVQQILNANIDRLKDNLQNQGLTIDRCDVSMQNKQEEYQQNLGRQAFYQDDGSAQDGNDRRRNSDEEANVSAGKIVSENPGRVLKTSTDAENISLFA
ncbi:MAG: flagellar hook-length control protein FliK [Smithella sp.]